MINNWPHAYPVPVCRIHWVEMYSRSSIRSFDEELEQYEMLDLDADGDGDVDVNVDEDTGYILMG